MAVLFDVIKIILNDSLHYYEGKFFLFSEISKNLHRVGKIIHHKKKHFSWPQ